MMVEPIPNEPEPRGESHHEPDRSNTVVPERSTAGLLDQARKRFKELAVSSVEKCALRPEMVRAVLHSLELGFARTIKEDGRVMQRRFDQDVEAAVTWAAESLVEACRHLAAVAPSRKRSPLQNLALLEVQALEIMLPELSQANAVESADINVPAAQLRSFCLLLNDGLDFAHKADTAADRRDQYAYQGNYVLSRNKLRNAARLLRRMLSGAGSGRSDLTVGLHGFQLELAAYAGSIRMFLKALRARDTAAPASRRHTQMLESHCLVEDLLPILFDRHFAFTIRTPRGIPAHRSQELVKAAHETVWQNIAPPVSELLAHPGRLHPVAFKDAVETELRKAIQEVNQQFAPDRVVASISSNNVREIRRREW